MTFDEDAVVARALVLADELLASAHRQKASVKERRFRRLLFSNNGTRFVFALLDRVYRPVDARVASRQLQAITTSELSGLSRIDLALLRTAALVAQLLPNLVVVLVKTRIRLETRPFIAPLEPKPLGRRLGALSKDGRRLNLNILGELVLGWQEASRRTGHVEALLRRSDVECVSVKMSSIAPNLSLMDFEGSIERASEPLRQLYRLACAGASPKLVNLDMEEHRDLDLTIELFTRVLAEPEFAHLTAGIAIQAYLPDSHVALDRLVTFGASRIASGAAPIRIRLVKGANLAMERVDTEIHGWPVPNYPSKSDTDASYKLLLQRLICAAAEGTLLVGVASHNLFDLAYALSLADAMGTEIALEMLAGMADAQASALSRRTDRLLFYLPVTAKADFRNAMAYLARRLDENATPEGFLRHVFEFAPGSTEWTAQRERFLGAVRARDQIPVVPRQTQDRTAFQPRQRTDHFFNEPDTDLTVARNRAWASQALRVDPTPSPLVANMAEVDAAVERAAQALREQRTGTLRERKELLFAAARTLSEHRQEAIATMAHEAGKSFGEGDPEVSEAIDYADWYARQLALFESVEPATTSEPLGVVVIASPWNFPLAIPAGGVLSNLAAGNAVLLKPSPEARATAAFLVDQLHRAGFDLDVVQLVPTDDDDAGKRLISHPGVNAVVLTGSWETAATFAEWVPERRLLAETNGKNAIVVAATADVDLAVRDLVRSAFGHAGQKCSAASLAIIDASIYDQSSFLRQLEDATRSLRVGPATKSASEVGPIVGPLTPALLRALTTLDDGEHWLVEPRQLEERLWSPGVRIGVQPGSWAHRVEWFGPMLAVVRVDGLDEAIRVQNGVVYGLTAGLHSLDPREQRYWADRVQAGNLYINRHITGAMVGRHPFGGWKRSSFGPTTKAGGPNTVLSLRHFRDAHLVSVADALVSYESAMKEHFSSVIELTGLESEANVFRYHPMESVLVRFSPQVAPHEIEKASAAARLAGTPVRFSSAIARPDLDGVVPVAVQSELDCPRDLAAGAMSLLRILGTPEHSLFSAAHQGAVAVLDEPICSQGRVELVRWMREQSISASLHRYGNLVYSKNEMFSDTRS